MNAPCLYCGAKLSNVEICIGCRTKFEMAKAELERVKKDRDHYRRQYLKLVKQECRRSGKRG